MERNELLQRVQWTKTKVTELEKHREEAAKNEQLAKKAGKLKFFNIKSKLFYILGFITYILYIFAVVKFFDTSLGGKILLSKIPNLREDVDGTKWQFFDLVFLKPTIFYIIAVFVIAIIVWFITKPSRIAKSAIYNDLVKKSERQINAINQDLINNQFVPQDYLNSFALDYFEKYITNLRADTLKECIDKFEQEKMTREFQEKMLEAQQANLNALKGIQQSNKRINSELQGLRDDVEGYHRYEGYHK